MSSELVGLRADALQTPASRLPLPAGVAGRRIAWQHAIGVIFYHAVALLAVLPWFFSWTGVVLALARALRIRHARHQHRLPPPAHASRLRLPALARAFSAVLGVCCLQDTPARWVAVHRHASSALRRAAATRTARWSVSSGATWAGCWSRTRSATSGRLRALRQGLFCATAFTGGWNAAAGSGSS